MMTRLAFMTMAGTLLAHAACSDDDPPASPKDAGTDSPPVTEGGPVNPPFDAGCQDPDPATIDCSVDGGADAGLPGDLRCTGLYACFSNKTVAATAQPFLPGIQLWSDGAEKSRWLVLPAGTKIDANDVDHWVFPVGTKAFKEFKVGGKRVETRLFQKVAEGKGMTSWQATLYRWSADGESSATRLDTGDMVGDYQVPPTNLCTRCHTGSADVLLGVEAWSLGNVDATGLTLGKLKEQALIAPAPAATTFAIPEDSTGKAAAALGWLHANCGSCHNNGTGSAKFTNLHLNLPSLAPDGGAASVTTTPTYLTAVNQPMRAGSRYETVFPGLQRINGGDSANSLLWKADSIRNTDGGISPEQMPPFLVRKIDPKAAAVAAWIDALP